MEAAPTNFELSAGSDSKLTNDLYPFVGGFLRNPVTDEAFRKLLEGLKNHPPALALQHQALTLKPVVVDLIFS